MQISWPESQGSTALLPTLPKCYSNHWPPLYGHWFAELSKLQFLYLCNNVNDISIIELLLLIKRKSARLLAYN